MKENERGSSSGTLVPHSTQASFRRIEALFAVDHGNQHETVGQARGGLDGGFEALLDAGLDEKAVDDDFDRMVAALIEGDLVFERADHPVDACLDETLAGELFQFLAELAFAPADDGRHHEYAVVGAQRKHVLEDLFGGLAGDFAAAHRTVRHPDRGIKQTQIVVNLSDRSDCASGASPVVF